MIIKWYEVTCDYCKTKIGNYRGNQYLALEQAVKDGTLIKYIENKRLEFCDEKCYKKYLEGLRGE